VAARGGEAPTGITKPSGTSKPSRRSAARPTAFCPQREASVGQADSSVLGVNSDTAGRHAKMA